MDLTNMKIKLGITDDAEDELLAVLLSDAINFMHIYMNLNVPTELEFIAEEVAIKRYRRIGSEGINTEKVDVLSTTYNTENDFNEYLPIMNRYKKRKSGGGGFRFI